MYQKVLYGTDTGSIEDYYQCVVLLIPDDVEDVEEYIEAEGGAEFIPSHVLVTWEDVSESFALAMQAEGIDPAIIALIVQTVSDAIDNND